MVCTKFDEFCDLFIYSSFPSFNFQQIFIRIDGLETVTTKLNDVNFES